MTFPNLFIVGQAKAGTTSLAKQLAQHPDVFLPRIKEPHYMCRSEGLDWYYYNQPLVYCKKEYEELYKGAGERYRIDGSVHYLRFESAALEIQKNVPDAKIIAVIREPISRIVSHYLMDTRSGVVNSSLNDILQSNNKYKDEYIGCSMSSRQISIYIRLFGASNVLLIDYDKYAKNNQQCLDEVTRFLGISDMVFEPVAENVFRAPKPYIKFLYSNYYARKIYGLVVPDRVRNILRNYLLDWKRPTIDFDVDVPELNDAKADYNVLVQAMSCHEDAK